MEERARSTSSGLLLWPSLGYLRGHLLDYLTTSSIRPLVPLSLPRWVLLSLWCVLCPFRGGVVARMCVEAKAVGSGTRQGHGYQLLVSSPFHHHLLSVLLSLSLSLSLFFVFVLPIILSVPVSRPFPPRGKQPSWGMCNVIECTENNNKLFLGRHSPSTSSGGLPSVFPSFRPSVPRSFRRYLRFKECMYIRR